MGVVVNGSCSPINIEFTRVVEISARETPVVEALGVLSSLLTGDVLTGTGCPTVVKVFSAQFSFSFPFSKCFLFSAGLLRHGGAKTLKLSSLLDSSTLISTGSKFVLSNPSESLRLSNGSELVPCFLIGPRLSTGAILLSSKGKSHLTQASTFDFGVLYAFLRLLRL